MLGVSFDLKELCYRALILAVGLLNVVLDNWPMVVFILFACVFLRMLWRILTAEVDDEG